MIVDEYSAHSFEAIRRNLYTAVVGDIMDEMGYEHQFLPPEIQPLTREMKLVGRAMPVLECDYVQRTNASSHTTTLREPFGLMLDALDDLCRDEVYVCGGGSRNYAMWGGLMTTRALHLQAAGVVLDGFVRDTLEVLELGLPVFSCGSYAQDQAPRGKVVDFRVPITVGQARIEPGDLVIADCDGVCVVPQPIEAEVIEHALEKVRGENKVRSAIQRGMGARQAFERFGVM